MSLKDNRNWEVHKIARIWDRAHLDQVKHILGVAILEGSLGSSLFRCDTCRQKYV